MNKRSFGVQSGCFVLLGGTCSELTAEQEAIWEKVDRKFNYVGNE